MFERVVVPLDGSEIAEACLGQVAPLLRDAGAEVVLVRAVEIYPMVGLAPPMAGPWQAGDASISTLIESAETYIRAQAAALEDSGLKVRWIVRPGSASETILEVADHLGASMIALTSHGRSGIARWAFGSVTEKVLRQSGVPLLVLRSFDDQGNRMGATPLAAETVLVPSDGSRRSLSVVGPAVELAGRLGASVLLQHVRVEPPMGESDDSYAGQLLQHGVDAFAAAGVTVQTRLDDGDPAARILDAARTPGVGLIAMASHGRSGIPRWVIGSVAERVLRHAQLPMLIVRGARH